MSNYLRYADDILRGGRRAVGDFVGTIAGKGVKNAQGSLDNARRTQDALGQLSPEDLYKQYKQRMGAAPVKDYELKAMAKEFYDNAVSSASDNVENALLDLSEARLNRNVGRGLTGILGVTGAGVGGAIAAENGAFDGRRSAPPASSSMQEHTRRSNVLPTGDNVVIVEPEQAAVEKAAVEQAVAEQAAAQAVAEGTWTPQRGDTLYSKFGGDWDKINAFAELNKIDPNKIYANRVYKMIADTPSRATLNSVLR